MHKIFHTKRVQKVIHPHTLTLCFIYVIPSYPQYLHLYYVGNFLKQKSN